MERILRFDNMSLFTIAITLDAWLDYNNLKIESLVKKHMNYEAQIKKENNELYLEMIMALKYLPDQNVDDLFHKLLDYIGDSDDGEGKFIRRCDATKKHYDFIKNLKSDLNEIDFSKNVAVGISELRQEVDIIIKT